MRRFLVTLFAAGFFLLAAADAPAAGRRFLGRASGNHAPQAAQTAQHGHAAQNGPVWVQPGGGPYRYNPYHQYKAMYPKYYWGLHAKTYQNIGIPNGDIGIRGNGITPNPW